MLVDDFAIGIKAALKSTTGRKLETKQLHQYSPEDPCYDCFPLDERYKIVHFLGDCLNLIKLKLKPF